MMQKILGLPVLGSVHGKDVDILMLYIHLLMVALFIGWFIYLVYAIWRFRERRSPKADYVGTTTHASTWIEGAVALVEGVLLIGLAVPIWAKAVDKFPDRDKSTQMRIIGRQFNWIARYPGADGKFVANKLELVTGDNPMGMDRKDAAAQDDIVVEGSEMVVPVNKPVLAHITSLDVIHSFKVVPLRVTQDANPGMSIPIHFLPTITNTYLIQCSQLCGNGHYSMRGIFRVLPEADYAAWLASKPKVGGAAAAPSYE